MNAGPAVIVVLAAGQGSRFNGSRHKLLQDIGTVSVLTMTITHALATQLPVVVVTTQPLADIAASHVATRDIVVLPTVGSAGHPMLGMGYSIAAGVANRADAFGWLILPGDMPMVKPATLQAVAREMEHHSIVYAQHNGKRGHPVGFTAELYSELMGLTGDEGAKRLLARYPSQGIEVSDPGVLMDVDTEADLLHARTVQKKVCSPDANPGAM